MCDLIAKVTTLQDTVSNESSGTYIELSGKQEARFGTREDWVDEKIYQNHLKWIVRHSTALVHNFVSYSKV